MFDKPKDFNLHYFIEDEKKKYKNEYPNLTDDEIIDKIYDTLKIRYLSPQESFKIMGFDYKDAKLLEKNGFSSNKIYKMAGNSIVVDVLMYLFYSLLTTIRL